MEKGAAVLVFVLAVAGAIGLVVVAAILRGYALSILWGWVAIAMTPFLALLIGWIIKGYM